VSRVHGRYGSPGTWPRWRPRGAQRPRPRLRVDVAAGAEPRTPRPQCAAGTSRGGQFTGSDPGPLSARSCCAWTAAGQRYDAAGGIGSPDHRRTPLTRATPSRLVNCSCAAALRLSA